VISDLSLETVHEFVKRGLEPGSNLYTDRWRSYMGLEADFAHETVDHAVTYVEGNIHTNYIENFWSLLKRGLHGTYISVQPFHLFRYLDERMFTFNERDLNDLRRFEKTLRSAAGRRLTWDQVTGHA